MAVALRATATGTDWEFYVRRAVPVSDDADSDDLEEVLALSPIDLPPPATLPRRNLVCFYSEYRMRVPDGSTASVPQHMIVRDHTCCKSHRLSPKPIHDSVVHVPHAVDIIVLAARDAEGDQQYGWYVRWRGNPTLLERVPYGSAECLWAAIRKDNLMKTSSLNESFVDSYFSNCQLDFDALVSIRLQATQQRYEQLMPAATNRKRLRYDTCSSQALYEQSKPASPAHASRKGHCTICLDEDVEVHVPSCCGQNAAACHGCRLKLRHICPVCERKRLNAAYQCLSCSSIVTLKEYGMPCSTCNKSTLCVGCYKDLGQCVDCDVIRCPRR